MLQFTLTNLCLSAIMEVYLLEFNIKKILNDKNILNQLQKNLFNFLDNQNNISEKDSNSIIDKIIN